MGSANPAQRLGASRRGSFSASAPVVGPTPSDGRRGGCVEDAKERHHKVKKMLEELDSTTGTRRRDARRVLTKDKHQLDVREDRGGDLLPGFEGSSQDQGANPRGIRGTPRRRHGHGRDGEDPFHDETWARGFSVRNENLEHHIEEEEGEMFKQARQVGRPVLRYPQDALMGVFELLQVDEMPGIRVEFE